MKGLVVIQHLLYDKAYKHTSIHARIMNTKCRMAYYEPSCIHMLLFSNNEFILLLIIL